MAPSKTTSTKASKLCIVSINYFSQQVRSEADLGMSQYLRWGCL